MGAGDTNAVDAGSGYLGKLVNFWKESQGVPKAGHFFKERSG